MRVNGSEVPLVDFGCHAVEEVASGRRCGREPVFVANLLVEPLIGLNSILPLLEDRGHDPALDLRLLHGVLPGRLFLKLSRPLAPLRILDPTLQCHINTGTGARHGYRPWTCGKADT